MLRELIVKMEKETKLLRKFEKEGELTFKQADEGKAQKVTEMLDGAEIPYELFTTNKLIIIQQAK